MSEAKQMARPAVDYEADYYAWTQEQAKRLRSARPTSVDWANVAEEIESLGRSDRREIRNRLRVLLAHLLKWQAQPRKRKSGWRGTIAVQRDDLAQLLRDSPSLSRQPRSILAEVAEVYVQARTIAADETGLPETMFPKTCPFTIDQILDENFWPEGG